jgi:hypothetical protein
LAGAPRLQLLEAAQPYGRLAPKSCSPGSRRVASALVDFPAQEVHQTAHTEAFFEESATSANGGALTPRFDSGGQYPSPYRGYGPVGPFCGTTSSSRAIITLVPWRR